MSSNRRIRYSDPPEEVKLSELIAMLRHPKPTGKGFQGTQEAMD